MNIVEDVTELIGKTPLVKLNKLVPEGAAEVIAKVETFNPGSSVKDRIALNMIETAEEEGKLEPGGTIVEPTSGNTGIGLSLVGAAKGYEVVLTMPESMSQERRKLLAALGAKLELTPADDGMPGAIERAEELAVENEDYFMPQQFKNPANPAAHRETTAQEILAATDGELDAFVAGVGTGGTITGLGEALKSVAEEIEIVAVEPADSPVLTGGEPGPHQIQGIGAGFVPEVLETDLLEEVIAIGNEEAKELARQLAAEEGLFVGVSSGAAVAAAIKVAKRLGAGSRVVTLLPDTGERYLSTDLFSGRAE